MKDLSKTVRGLDGTVVETGDQYISFRFGSEEFTIRETKDGRIALDQNGELLATDAPGTQKSLVRYASSAVTDHGRGAMSVRL